jgi:hypothetical protein
MKNNTSRDTSPSPKRTLLCEACTGRFYWKGYAKATRTPQECLAELLRVCARLVIGLE